MNYNNNELLLVVVVLASELVVYILKIVRSLSIHPSIHRLPLPTLPLPSFSSYIFII